MNKVQDIVSVNVPEVMNFGGAAPKGSGRQVMVVEQEYKGPPPPQNQNNKRMESKAVVSPSVETGPMGRSNFFIYFLGRSLKTFRELNLFDALHKMALVVNII